MLSPGNALDRWVVVSFTRKDRFGCWYRVRERNAGTIADAVLLATPHAGALRRRGEEHWERARSAHPGQLALLDVVNFGGTLGLVVRHAAGPTLAEALETYEPTPGEIEATFRDLLAAVADAHDRGVTGLDLSPDTIVLERGFPRLAGLGRFGVADDPTPWSPPAPVGDARDDVWALGAILRQLCFGAPPDGILEDADAPPHLARAMRACLDPDPATRARDTREILDVLEGRELVRAPRPASRARADRAARAYAAVVFSAIPLAAALTAVAFGVGLATGPNPELPTSMLLASANAALPAPSGHQRTCRARRGQPLGWISGVPAGPSVLVVPDDVPVHADLGGVAGPVSCVARKDTRLRIIGVPTGDERWAMVEVD